MNNLTIRLETEKDYRAVEELTREAFWNVYKPGADEHYFVHTMRSHPDFIPELAFVLELDGRIVGNIMYTKAWLEDENDERKGSQHKSTARKDGAFVLEMQNAKCKIRNEERRRIRRERRKAKCKGQKEKAIGGKNLLGASFS